MDQGKPHSMQKARCANLGDKVSSSNEEPTQPTVHAGFSMEGLLAVAEESSFLKQDPQTATREEIKQFVVELISENNAAVFLDFQILDRRCDALLARITELEIITGVS